MKKHVSKEKLQERAAKIIAHEIVDSGGHMSEIAGELAEYIVYGKRSMTIKELQKMVDSYGDVEKNA